jgi:hypothetical protein
VKKGSTPGERTPEMVPLPHQRHPGAHKAPDFLKFPKSEGGNGG